MYMDVSPAGMAVYDIRAVPTSECRVLEGPCFSLLAVLGHTHASAHLLPNFICPYFLRSHFL